ncbi:MAG: transglutaminase-like cysteine peptidase [Pseudomonadota bacterium]
MARHGYQTALCFKTRRTNPVDRARRIVRRVVRASALSAALIISTAVVAEATGPQTAAHLPTLQRVAAPDGFNGVCQRYVWACENTRSRVKSTEELLRVARSVNLTVNRSFDEVADQTQYNRQEYWALPTSIGGDCEDFALLKRQELMAMGVPGERLLIATVLDRQRRAHAVLVLRTDRGDMVLDNLTNRIKHWSATGYTFLRMQDPDAPSRWNAVFAGGVFAEAGV